MHHKGISRVFLIVSTIAFMTSCETADWGEVEEETTGKTNLTIRVSPYEITDFGDGIGAKNHYHSLTRAAISDVCTRIDMGIYMDSALVKSISQTIEDDDFGSASIELDEGNYQLVVVAHNGLVKCSVPKTMGDLYFSNNKVTDTFHYYGEINVTGSSEAVDIEVKRIVAMFRLKVSGSIPEDADSLNFYYIGGSTRIDPTTGLGTTDNRPNDYRIVSQDQTDYDIYTIPHALNDTIKVVVTAYDLDGRQRLQTTFSDVPVSVNHITQYAGDFFSSWNASDDADSDETGSASSFVGLQIGTITANPSWDGETTFDY